jgi:hypothetical protein
MPKKLPKYYRRKVNFSDKVANSYSHHRYLFLFTLFFFVAVFVLLLKESDIKIPQENITIEIDVKDQIRSVQ